MAGIDVGGGHGKRSVNHEIPLIPFIDFLLCLVAFLLVTAVWNQMSRVEANANVPHETPDSEEPPPEPPKVLNVEMKGDTSFHLVWKQGADVIDEVNDIPRKKDTQGDKGDYKYTELAKKITEQWNAQGAHKAATDPKFDLAVLRTDNTTPFADIVAVIDAIYAPLREVKAEDGTVEKVPAFNVTFAVD